MQIEYLFTSSKLRFFGLRAASKYLLLYNFKNKERSGCLNLMLDNHFLFLLGEEHWGEFGEVDAPVAPGVTAVTLTPGVGE